MKGRPNAGAVIVENATDEQLVVYASGELQEVLASRGVVLVATFKGKVLGLRVCTPEESSK